MPDHADEVAVVGAGVLGSAIFSALAGAGRSATLIERATVGSGTTCWSGGVVRCFHLDAAAMDRAVGAWRAYLGLAERMGERSSLQRCGMLYFPSRENLGRARELVRRRGGEVPLEWLGQRELAERFGELLRRVPRGAVWESGAAYLNPVEVTRWFAESGRRAGGTVLEGTEVDSLLRRRGRTVGVAGPGGTVRAEWVVLAAGAHTPALLDAGGIHHDLYVQEIQSDLRLPAEPAGGCPAFVDEVYALNGRGDARSGGVYVGCPTGFRAPRARAAVRPSRRHSARVARAGAARFSWLDRSTLCESARSAECYAPGGAGRVQGVAGDPRLLLATAFSGGGFKFAPWVGAEVTRLIGSGSGAAR